MIDPSDREAANEYWDSLGFEDGLAENFYDYLFFDPAAQEDRDQWHINYDFFLDYMEQEFGIDWSETFDWDWWIAEYWDGDWDAFRELYA